MKKRTIDCHKNQQNYFIPICGKNVKPIAAFDKLMNNLKNLQGEIKTTSKAYIQQ